MIASLGENPAVALGIYARVLQALRLENDLATIALDNVLCRKLQDASLGPNRRAPRRSAVPGSKGQGVQNPIGRGSTQIYAD
jgi:hypothetical protein